MTEKIGYKNGPLKKSVLEEFIGKWVIFERHNQPSTSGFFMRIGGDGREYCILNPYQHAIPSGGFSKIILYKDDSGLGKPIEGSSITSVELSTKEDLLKFCEIYNLQDNLKQIKSSRGIIVVSPTQASEFLKNNSSHY